MQKLETVTAKSERKKAVEQLNVIDRTRLQIPSFDEMDNGYKRLKYVRYADDFLIGVIGSKEVKALDGKGYADKLMIARRGKTIALC